MSLQFFRIRYSCFNTHVISVKDGGTVSPRLINYFRPRVPLTRLFDLSEILTIKKLLPNGVFIDELTSDDLYVYLMSCKSNHFHKVMPPVKEAWFSYMPDDRKKRRCDRKLDASSKDQIIELLNQHRSKADIARIVGLSRQALYKQLAKIEEQNFRERCLRGNFSAEVGSQIEKNGIKKGSYLPNREYLKIREEVISRFLEFDISQLKHSKSVNLRDRESHT